MQNIVGAVVVFMKSGFQHSMFSTGSICYLLHHDRCSALILSEYPLRFVLQNSQLCSDLGRAHTELKVLLAAYHGAIQRATGAEKVKKELSLECETTFF